MKIAAVEKCIASIKEVAFLYGIYRTNTDEPFKESAHWRSWLTNRVNTRKRIVKFTKPTENTETPHQLVKAKEENE